MQFQADSGAFSALFQRLDYFGQQIFCVVIDVQICITSYAERRRLQDLATQEKPFGKGAEDVFQKEEALFPCAILHRYGDDAVQYRRRHRQDSCLYAVIPFAAAQENSQVKAQAAEEGKGMARIDSHRRDDRVNFPFKVAFKPHKLFFIQLFRRNKTQAFTSQTLAQALQIRILLVYLFMYHRFDCIELFLRRHTGNIVMIQFTFDKVFNTGYADHKKFI